MALEHKLSNLKPMIQKNVELLRKLRAEHPNDQGLFDLYEETDFVLKCPECDKNCLIAEGDDMLHCMLHCDAHHRFDMNGCNRLFGICPKCTGWSDLLNWYEPQGSYGHPDPTLDDKEISATYPLANIGKNLPRNANGLFKEFGENTEFWWKCQDCQFEYDTIYGD